MTKGKLIVVEGACDGVGKTTQLQLLREHLQKDGEEVFTHHFPSYNTYQGKPVEMYLKGTYGQPNEVSPYFVNNLYALDRAITWLTQLKQEFEGGKIILLDRYTTSSLIYQSALIKDVDKKKAFIDYVCDYEYNRLGIQRPDNVIFLHAPFDLISEIRKARLRNEGVESDIHESNNDFMRDVYESAMFVSEYLGWNKVDCSQHDKMRSIEEVHQKVYTIVKQK